MAHRRSRSAATLLPITFNPLLNTQSEGIPLLLLNSDDNDASRPSQNGVFDASGETEETMLLAQDTPIFPLPPDNAVDSETNEERSTQSLAEQAVALLSNPDERSVYPGVRDDIHRSESPSEDPPAYEAVAPTISDDRELSPMFEEFNHAILPAMAAFLRQFDPNVTQDNLHRWCHHPTLPILICTLPFPLEPRLAENFNLIAGTTAEEVSYGRKIAGFARVYKLSGLEEMPCKNSLRLDLRFAKWAKGFGLEKSLLDLVFKKLSVQAAELQTQAGAYTGMLFSELWWPWWWPFKSSAPNYAIVQKGTKVLAHSDACGCEPIEGLPGDGPVCRHDGVEALQWKTWGFEAFARWEHPSFGEGREWIYYMREVE